MLEPWQISSYYINSKLDVPSSWGLTRKHVRIETLKCRFVKLNKFRTRLNSRKLKDFCITFAPKHVYFSVLNWLFPERVGKKYKGNYAVPVGSGEYVIDVDAYIAHRWHEHLYSETLEVCPICLQIAKELAIDACKALEWYYRDIHIVFSGRSGFHIHVLDFDVSDWTRINYNDLIKSHEVARFKFSKAITLQAFCFDRAHFILSVDPMRVITVPNTLNGDTGLKCIYVGDRKALERRTVENILWQAKALEVRYGYPELTIRAMNYPHKTGGGNNARVTAMTPPPKRRISFNSYLDLSKLCTDGE